MIQISKILILLIICAAVINSRISKTRVTKTIKIVRRVKGNISWKQSEDKKQEKINSNNVTLLLSNQDKKIHTKETQNNQLFNPRKSLKSHVEANYLALRGHNYKARQYTSTTAGPKIKRSINDEVSSMINQLKYDLETLLGFNENLLHFNSSIVKKAVKNKVESFFSTISNAIDSQIEETSDEDSVAAASNILEVTQDIGRSLASTLGRNMHNLILQYLFTSLIHLQMLETNQRYRARTCRCWC